VLAKIPLSETEITPAILSICSFLPVCFFLFWRSAINTHPSLVMIEALADEAFAFAIPLVSQPAVFTVAVDERRGYRKGAFGSCAQF
jgi:hypothetical protein